MPSNLTSLSPRSVSPTLYLSKNATQDTLLSEVETAIDAFKNNNVSPLHAAITTFRDNLSRLPFWQRILEKIKALFGLSHVIEDDNDMALLYMMSLVQESANKAHLNTKENKALSWEVIRILKESHQVPDYIEGGMKTLTADIVVRLLERHPHLQDIIQFETISFSDFSEDNKIKVSGMISFENIETHLPGFPRALPFYTEYTPEDPFLHRLGGDKPGAHENVTRFRTIIKNAGSGKSLSALAMSNWKNKSHHLSLLLNEVNAHKVLLASNRDEVLQNVLSLARTNDISANYTLRLQNYVFSSYIPEEDMREQNHLMLDIERIKLTQTTIVVNGQSLPTDTVKKMQGIIHQFYDQFVALTSNSQPCTQVEQVLSSELLNTLDAELHDPILSKNVLSTLWFSALQMGPGHGILHSLTTPGSQHTVVSAPTEYRLQIDIPAHKNTITVDYSAFHRGCDEGNKHEVVQAGGVAFLLNANQKADVIDSIYNFFKNDIPVEGFGLRYTEAAPAQPALQISEIQGLYPPGNNH